MADASAVDTAVISKLAGDAQLLALLPGGVHFGLAPQGVTAFALVAIDETSDVGGVCPDGRRSGGRSK